LSDTDDLNNIGDSIKKNADFILDWRPTVRPTPEAMAAIWNEPAAAGRAEAPKKSRHVEKAKQLIAELLALSPRALDLLRVTPIQHQYLEILQDASSNVAEMARRLGISGWGVILKAKPHRCDPRKCAVSEKALRNGLDIADWPVEFLELKTGSKIALKDLEVKTIGQLVRLQKKTYFCSASWK